MLKTINAGEFCFSPFLPSVCYTLPSELALEMWAITKKGVKGGKKLV